jgi:hypothetical protein
VWHLARAARPENVEQAFLRERCGLDAADAHEAVRVDRRNPRPLADRDMQRGDVRIADEGLGVLRDEVEVEERNRLCRAEASLECLDDVDLGICEERV